MPLFILLLTIAIEGYVVLATELLAIRQLTPYVGSATDTVSIIIASVLLPLAFGYHAGGNTKLPAGDSQALYTRLTRNLLVAGAFLVAGLAHIHMALFFTGLEELGLTHRVLQTTLYCVLFLSYPTFLLGQTVPLVSNGLPKSTIARTTGKMLFVSTFGSFMGSVFSTLVLMTFLGVNITVILTLGLLLGLIILLAWPATTEPARTAIFLAIMLFTYLVLVNNNSVMKQLGIVSNTTYSQVAVMEHQGGSRSLLINNSNSSKWAATPSERFSYIAFLEDNVIARLPTTSPQNILVLGAGGFTLGLKDITNNYTYVDLDPTLLDISEQFLLRASLTANKTFVAESARPFLRQSTKRYNLIVVDVFTNRYNIPPDMLTQEFLTDIRRNLTAGGTIALNFIASPTFADTYSRTFDTTFRSVFPYTTRQVISWKSNPANIIYLSTLPESPQEEAINLPYTDDKNRYFIDK